MKTLKTELLEVLGGFEMTFQESNNRTRFAEFVGEELTFRGSLRRCLAEAQLSEHELELRRLIKQGILKTCLDDGWLHLTFSNELLNEQFLAEIDFD
jgi:hypothetical protein